MITLYNVISSDGFIARPDGREDFISDDFWPHTLEFFKSYDALVMGRETYDAMQRYGASLLRPFEKLSLTKVIVTRNAAFKPKPGYIVAHSPNDAIALLDGKNILVSSGPNFNSQLIRGGRVRKVIWWRVPEAIGEGILPFDKDLMSMLAPPSISPGPLDAISETRSAINVAP